MGFFQRMPNHLTKVITFDGVNFGAIGTTPLFTVSGCVWLEYIGIRCITSLTGTSATIALGTVGNTGGIVAATTATGITAAKLWLGTSAATGVAAAITNYQLNLNAILTVATAAVTGGSLAFELYWYPSSPTGQIS